jgi:pimeloyl-ACP methyl ester carboxylesterase
MWFVTGLRRGRIRRAGGRSRFHSVTTSAGCFRVHCFEAGTGAPVVLVHGMNGSGEYWADLIPVLVDAGYRVYAPDLLGFGRSEAPDVDYSMRLQAETLSGLLQSLGVQKARLLGVSLGGFVALRIAVDYPEAVGALLLLNSVGTSFETDVDMRLFSPESVEELQSLLSILTTEQPQFPRFFARDLVRTLRRHGWVVRRTIASIFTRRDLLADEDLEGIQAKTLLLWGEKDQLVPLENGEKMQRAIPGAELQVLSGCGHAILETRGEEVTRRALKFLATTR